MYSPLFSIVIPTYNCACWLSEAIQSALNQTVSNIEIIVVDDGSTDETRSMVERFTDPRVRYIFQRNAGPSCARNTGIAVSNAPYVAFLDADDLLLPDALGSHAQQIRQHPHAGMYIGGHRIVNAAGMPLAKRQPWIYHSQLDLLTCLYGAPIVPSAVVVQRTWLDQVGGFDPLQRSAEDPDLWLRLTHASCPSQWTPETVCLYRIHPGQTIRDGTTLKRMALRMLDRFFLQSSLPAEVLSQRDAIYAAHYVMAAMREYMAGQIEVACDSLSHALRLNPDLMHGPVPPLADALIAWAADPLTGDPASFVTHVLENLPPPAIALAHLRDRLILMASLQAALDALDVSNFDLARGYLGCGWAGSRLTDDTSFDLHDLIVNAVRTWPADRQVEMAHLLLHSLPADMRRQISDRIVLGRVYMAQGFTAHEMGNIAQVAPSFLRGIWREPTWLRNRGVWAILGRSLLHRIIAPQSAHNARFQR